MKWLKQSSPRRALLRRGLLAAGSLVGLAAGRRVSARDEDRAFAPAEADPGTLRFYGRGLATGGARTGAGSASVVRRFDLLDAPGGQAVGEFVATVLHADASFGAHGAAACALEMQTFRIGGDTLFGIGSSAPGAARAYAVLGGTGRFAGARGSCLERALEGTGSLRSEVEFVVTLVG